MKKKKCVAIILSAFMGLTTLTSFASPVSAANLDSSTVYPNTISNTIPDEYAYDYRTMAETNAMIYNENENNYEEIQELLANLSALNLYRTKTTLDIAGESRILTRGQLMDIEEKERLIDLQLEELGVTRIDPNNLEHMAFLEKLMLAHVYDNTERSTLPPPNLAAIANYFTLRQLRGTRNFNGVIYEYAYIIVTDNVGSGLLTESSTMVRHPGIQNNASSFRTFINDSRVQLATTTAIGLVPLAGSPLSFVLSVLFSLPPGVSHGSNVSYTSSKISVTEITYHYVFRNGDWRHAGTSASASFGGVNYFVGNVNGRADTWAESTSYRIPLTRSWSQVIDGFLQTNSAQIHALPNITTSGIGVTHTHRPVFARVPHDIIFR